MPSPFPGMDPYLEGDLWTSVHAQLAAEIARQLGPKLRPRYVALTVERFVLDVPDDVSVEASDICHYVGTVPTGVSPPNGGETTTVKAPLQLATVVPTRVPHFSVEIKDAKHRRLVTAIEILSPANKRGRGRRQYLSKRRRVLLSQSHLMEIDLIRQGKRVPMQEPLPQTPYFVLLSRVERRPILEVWPISLPDSLPAVPVPLLAGDADVLLDLQSALTSIYDSIGYDLIIDYAHRPDVPLATEMESWANERLHTAGLRS